MEGLEISEVLISQVSFENNVFRIDAEYFKKQYLKEDRLRYNYENVYLGEDYFITDGQHGYHEVDENSDIRHLTARNFKNWFANDIGAERLAQWVDDNNQRSSLKVNDVVLSTRGSVGYCAIVKQEVLPANIDQDVARIAVTREDRILPQFLVAYLNSKFGQDWTTRNQTGMVQQGLALWRVRELPIPRLSILFQDMIQGVVEKSHFLITQSKEHYSQAETLLLEPLGLKDFEPSKEAVNIKSFNESFGASGRLDAEYYQVKYDDLEDKIKLNSNFQKISDIRTDNYRGLQPIYVEGGDLDVINSKHILEKALDYGNFEKTSINFWDEQERARVFKGDILTYTTGANIGRTQVYNIKKKALASNHVNILRLKEGFNPNYIGFVMNSQIGRMQTEQLSAGSAQAELYPKDIDNFLIPIINIEIQDEIVSSIEDSNALKELSEQLLELAKTAVEKAIEENEEKAMEYVSTMIKKIEGLHDFSFNQSNHGNQENQSNQG